PNHSARAPYLHAQPISVVRPSAKRMLRYCLVRQRYTTKPVPSSGLTVFSEHDCRLFRASYTTQNQAYHPTKSLPVRSAPTSLRYVSPNILLSPYPNPMALLLPLAGRCSDRCPHRPLPYSGGSHRRAWPPANARYIHIHLYVLISDTDYGHAKTIPCLSVSRSNLVSHRRSPLAKYQKVYPFHGMSPHYAALPVFLPKKPEEPQNALMDIRSNQ